MDPLVRELAALSAREMVVALGAGRAPRVLQRGLALPFMAASRGLAETLAAFDRELQNHGLAGAARRALERFGVALEISGEPKHIGPRLVLANHPGAYDALALMAAIGRDDLLILAADRGFLRALPHLSKHFAFVAESSVARAGALKRAVSCLKRGGAVLQFPAGQIEPDANFEATGAHLLGPWRPGVNALVRACAHAEGVVVAAGVRGVHSPRAKRWRVNRWAEGRGVTTLSPLLQIVGRLRDVEARVHVDAGEPAAALSGLAAAALHERLRARLLAAILRA